MSCIEITRHEIWMATERSSADNRIFFHAEMMLVATTDDKLRSRQQFCGSSKIENVVSAAVIRKCSNQCAGE